MAAPAYAAAPVTKPHSLRGVEMGITLEQFHQTPVPVDEPGFVEPLAWCTNQGLPAGVGLTVDEEDRADGIVRCQWFSNKTNSRLTTPWMHFIQIGTLRGSPMFDFVPTADGRRLFRILIVGDSVDFAGLLEALARNNGPPKAVTEPFKVRSGAAFTSTTATWNNGLSTITLVERCTRLDSLCLTYEHNGLLKVYSAIKDRRAAAAAEKIQ